MNELIKSIEKVEGATENQKSAFLNNINYELGKIYEREARAVLSRNSLNPFGSLL